jgi:peroxiredoxin Q/BCP
MAEKLEGRKAPDFTLEGSDGRKHSLADYEGKTVVLYFYPKDNTSGCTKEACAFRDLNPELQGLDAVVLGVSRDSLASHGNFIVKFGLPFVLLSDPDASVMQSYGAFGEKTSYGKTTTGTIRSTFLIDESGRIARVWSPVKVDGHADEVLAAVEGGGRPAAP